MNLKEYYKYMKKAGRDQKYISKIMDWDQSTVSKFINHPLEFKLSAYDMLRLQDIFGFQTMDHFFEAIQGIYKT
jgi:hypothetical protein